MDKMDLCIWYDPQKVELLICPEILIIKICPLAVAVAVLAVPVPPAATATGSGGTEH